MQQEKKMAKKMIVAAQPMRLLRTVLPSYGPMLVSRIFRINFMSVLRFKPDLTTVFTVSVSGHELRTAVMVDHVNQLLRRKVMSASEPIHKPQQEKKFLFLAPVSKMVVPSELG